MRKLKLMGMISAAVMALVMAVSLTGCGDDASSVSRATKTTTKAASEDKDAASDKEDGNGGSDESKSEESKSEESKSEESKSEDGGSEGSAVAEGDGSSMSQEEWEEYAQTDEYIQNMACQAAGQEAQNAVREEFGEGDWRTNYPTILNYTDKNNYDLNVEIYKEDEPDTVYTYHYVNNNGSFSIERVG